MSVCQWKGEAFSRKKTRKALREKERVVKKLRMKAKLTLRLVVCPRSPPRETSNEGKTIYGNEERALNREVFRDETLDWRR